MFSNTRWDFETLFFSCRIDQILVSHGKAHVFEHLKGEEKKKKTKKKKDEE